MKHITLGILDFGIRHSKMNSMMKLENVLESVIQAEALGYSRYWIGEHHASGKSMAWSNPQAVLPLLANATQKIRIGVAGVLLSLYSPYHIATFFKLLHNIFQRRIDLGIANGRPCTDAIRFSTQKDKIDRVAFEQKLKELVFLLRADEVLYRDGEGVVIPPYKGDIPEIWALTSSAYRSAQRIVDLKLNLCRSIYHQRAEKEFARERLSSMQEDYLHQHGALPKLSLAISVICEQTMEKAKKQAQLLPDAEDTLTIAGDSSHLQECILELSEQYGVDEFILYIHAIYPKQRQEAMQMISETFNLQTSTLCQQSI